MADVPAGKHEPIFACPVCGQPLPRFGRVFRCVRGHSFDVAKEGYVNLLLAQYRHSRDPGYSKEMIAGRREFFDSGYYQPLADGIAELVDTYVPGGVQPVVLDAGCGEGYYLRRLRARMEDRDCAPGALRCGIDISRHGVRVAARRDRGALYAVAGIHHMPVLPSRVDVLLTHFSPVSAADFRRVVRPGGVVLVGAPAPGHLFTLKEFLYDTPLPHEPEAALADEPGFKLAGTYRFHYKLTLHGPDQVANLLLMTPYYWSASQQVRERLARLDAFDTEVDVTVQAYLRTREPRQGTENQEADAGSGG